MLKKIASIMLVSLCLLALASCDGDPNEKLTESESVFTSEEYGAVFITGLDRDTLAQNSEISEWFDLCAEKQRDDFGTYVFKYTEEQGEEILYRYLVYRTDIEKSADRKLSFSEGGFLTAEIIYTSNDGKTAGYDLTYAEFSTPADKKVMLDVLCDGDYLGTIITNTDFNFGEIVK